MNEPLEIERKFLIEKPSEALLTAHASKRLELTQTYLERGENGESRRVRHVRQKDGEAWYFTEKVHLTARTRIEREEEITRERYEELLALRDLRLNTIRKTRWCVPFAGHTLEIDIFPFWERQAYCECELKTAEEELLLPDWLRVLREVTEDRRYTNHSLAGAVPPEDL